MRRKNKLLVASIVSMILIGLGIFGMANEPRYGGTLRVAVNEDPGTLDGQIGTSMTVTGVSLHIYETLFAYDYGYTPIPCLVESVDKKSDGLEVTLHLRQGVLFHNGEELDSGDVVASLHRWGEFGSHGPTLFEYVEDVVAVDEYTVLLTFNEPFGALESMLAYPNGGAFIYLQEVAETAGGKPISPEQAIGTGPYMLDEWMPGKQLKMVKFEEHHGDPAGIGIGYLDEIVYVPVGEAQTRVSGLLTGEFGHIMYTPADYLPQLREDERVKVLDYGYWFNALMMNTQEGLMSNTKMRQAMQAALDMEPILMAGWPGIYELEGTLAVPGSLWYTTAGTERYNQGNPEKAMELAKEAGYSGEAIRFICSGTSETYYNGGLVITDQLRRAGFNVALQLYDWPSIMSRRNDPALWDMFYTSHTVKPDPIFMAENTPYYPCWWSDPRAVSLTDELKTTVGFENRYPLWEQLHRLYYEEAPWVKTGSFRSMITTSNNVMGFEEPRYPPFTDIFTYVWLAEE